MTPRPEKRDYMRDTGLLVQVDHGPVILMPSTEAMIDWLADVMADLNARAAQESTDGKTSREPGQE